MLIFTDKNFDVVVLDNLKPVLVDFWAPWCGPCRALEPELEKVEANLTGTVVFGKLNIDDNEKIPNTYSISSVPTLLLFKNGEVIDQIIGAAPKSNIEAMLQKHL
jgi:thioredoxin 1